MKKDTFERLLSVHCGEIVNKVLDGMSKNRYKVGSGKISVPTMPIVYRWWFPELFVNEVLMPYSAEYPPLKTLLKEVDTLQKDGKTFCALYFGKSVNGHHRFSQHSTGNIHISTLRRTLYGLLFGHIYDKEKEKDITQLLKECCYEWYVFDKEEESFVKCVETICIALGKYPLNVEGNPAISEEWRKFLMVERNIKNI